MDNFIINTPQHKRWWLPDGLHQYNTVIFGDTERISVLRARDGSEVFHHYIRLSHPEWEQLSGIAQDLANKRFPKQLRHKSRAHG